MKAKDFASLENLALTLFFLLPLFYLISKFDYLSSINFLELIRAIKSSLIQSAAAAALCVFVGLPAAMGLQGISEKLQKVTKLLLVLPQVLPVIFTILIVFTIVKPFPMGPFGIIILFFVVNFGLATLILAEAIRQKIGKSGIVAEIFGVSQFAFFKNILIPTLYKDIIRCFYLIFVFCFASFSIPLIAGGGKSVNFEILIYEKIYVQTDWGGAVSLAIIQSLCVFFLSLPTISHDTKKTNDDFINSRLLISKFGLLLICGYIFLYGSGYLWGLSQSVSYIKFVTQHLDEILLGLAGSLQFFFISSVFSLFLIYLLTKSFVHHEKMPLILNYLSPSTVVVGFSIYLLFSGERHLDAYKFVFAFSVLSVPALFKLFIQSRLQQLNSQLSTAKIFGLSNETIIFKIIFPQIKKSLGLFLIVQTFWVLGDFSISRAVGLQTSTLGLITESFLSSYRLQAAYLTSFLILIIWAGISGLIYYFTKENHVKNT
jgi:thiamine transport system permease protein